MLASGSPPSAFRRRSRQSNAWSWCHGGPQLTVWKAPAPCMARDSLRLRQPCARPETARWLSATPHAGSATPCLRRDCSKMPELFCFSLTSGFGAEPVRPFARSPVRPFARSPVRPFARSPVRPFASRPFPGAVGSRWHVPAITLSLPHRWMSALSLKPMALRRSTGWRLAHGIGVVARQLARPEPASVARWRPAPGSAAAISVHDAACGLARSPAWQAMPAGVAARSFVARHRSSVCSSATASVELPEVSAKRGLQDGVPWLVEKEGAK